MFALSILFDERKRYFHFCCSKWKKATKLYKIINERLKRKTTRLILMNIIDCAMKYAYETMNIFGTNHVYRQTSSDLIPRLCTREEIIKAIAFLESVLCDYDDNRLFEKSQSWQSNSLMKDHDQHMYICNRRDVRCIVYVFSPARSGPCAHQLSLPSLVTVPVTSVVCVAAINLACPNLARYYFALLLRVAPESAGIFHRTLQPPFLRTVTRARPFYYDDNHNKTYRCFLNKEVVKLWIFSDYKSEEKRVRNKRRRKKK